MILTLEKHQLSKYVQRQLAALFSDGSPTKAIKGAMDQTLDRLATCISAVADTRFWRDGETFFNHLHSDQYAMFIYLLSNTLFHQNGPLDLCEKLFILNKTLYGIDVFTKWRSPTSFCSATSGTPSLFGLNTPTSFSYTSVARSVPRERPREEPAESSLS